LLKLSEYKLTYNKVGDKSLRELSHMPFFPVAGEVLDELDRKLWEIKVKVG